MIRQGLGVATHTASGSRSFPSRVPPFARVAFTVVADSKPGIVTHPPGRDPTGGRTGIVSLAPARPRLARHRPRRRDVNSEGHRAMIPQALTPPPGGLPPIVGQFALARLHVGSTLSKILRFRSVRDIR